MYPLKPYLRGIHVLRYTRRVVSVNIGVVNLVICTCNAQGPRKFLGHLLIGMPKKKKVPAVNQMSPLHIHI